MKVGRILAANALVAWLAYAPVARAADPTPGELLAARELFAKAEKDEDAGRWPAALEKLRRAASVKMTPGLRFHIALCEEKLGQLASALNDYATSESLARDAGNREVLDVVAEPLAALRARIPTLTVNVPANVKGAEVTLDGAPLPSGLWSTAIPVDIGPHAVQAKATERAGFSASVTLAEREAKVIEVNFPAPAAAQPAVPAPAVAAPTAQATAAEEPEKGSRLSAVLATAGAVVLAGGGVASFLVADGKQSDARSACATQVTCDDRKGPVRTFDWLALGAWVGAAALGTVAIVLWASPGSGRERTSGVQIGPGSLGLWGRF
jgi:hypothetical protein